MKTGRKDGPANLLVCVGIRILGCRLSTRVHWVDFVDQPFVGIPFDAVGVDLAFESLSVRDY